MVGRHELTDAAWARIEPLLPATGGRGGRWRDHRQVINAILWQAKTGVPRWDPAGSYGAWETAHEGARKWGGGGHRGPTPQHRLVKGEAGGAAEWVESGGSL